MPWEQRKLGEFVSSLRSGLSRMLDSEDIGLPVIRANNINNGYVDLENDIKYWYQIDPMGANTRNYLVAKDDILINFINSESRMGSAAIMRSIPSRDTIYTTNILRLRLTSDLDPYWFYIQTQSKLYLEYIKSISKVAVNQASFTTVEFKNFTFFCPSTKEQTQIGNFFKQLDDTIALHQREFEKFKILRKAYLKHIFIDDTTQFRAEKTIPWEQCKLGDVVNIIMGQSPDSKNYTNNSSDHILVQGNADIKNGFVYPRVWTTQITKQGHSGDLIMSVRAPVGDIAKTEYDVVLGRGVCAIKGNEFIFQLLTKMKENDYWESLSTGSTFDSINSNDIKNAEIFIPSLEEQTQIGNFFKQLDDTIALHQKELAKYQQIKTACLEKMFVE
nr:restriction endonuclease subunit S [Haemophilus parahaemolyticus]